MKKEYTIHVDVNNKKLFYEEFDDEFFSKELSDYIMRKINRIPLYASVKLELESSKLSESEKVVLKSKIKAYYQSILDDNAVFSKMSFRRNVGIFLLGILLIACHYYFNSFLEPIFLEFLMIAGWLMIWEILYDVFFANKIRKYELKRIKQLLNAKVVFVSNEK